MERYICIHAHFYQPPRENPWLETIELQDSAYPYHDWNERISAECYVPNAASRILDDKGRITKIVNNYEQISFNFGPTLLAWMERKTPDVYTAIINADRQSAITFSGHGSALAQAYNHMILPLANRRDKHTQVLWGIRDFQHRFNRKPEGMWLPETAVDLETLDILAEHGIKFTILAQHQANRMRPIWNGDWQDVSGGKIDPTRPYICLLPSGRSIVIFFYDGPISRAVAFEKLLDRGDSYAMRLLDGFSGARSWPQIVNIATDGETYGHHHHFGDMALAYALRYLQINNLARLTNYGEYLSLYAPAYEVEIFENTSWSCVHGIERWRNDCGCNTGGRHGWSQSWRTPLRDALDWLRDTLADVYERRARATLKDPWAARNDYIDVILDRSEGNIKAFLDRHAVRPLNDAETQTALKLLELQRHAMLMYTSCGWFFDELSGIETVQVIQYAGRALQLCADIEGDGPENEFLDLLEMAKSNLPEHGNGRTIYEKFVKSAVIDLQKVGAHYAVSSIFEEYPDESSIYCYTVRREDYRSSQVGKTKLAVGRAKVTSEITRESANLGFGVLHFGDHNLNCGVREYRGAEAYGILLNDLFETFEKADLPGTLRLLDKHFGASTYSLRSLFRDEQRKILDSVLESAIDEAETMYRQIYEHHVPIMRFVRDSGIPLSRALLVAAELFLNASLRDAFSDEKLAPHTIEPLVEQAQELGVSLEIGMLEYTLRKTLERLTERFSAKPDNLKLLKKWETVLKLLPALPFSVNLWKVENAFYHVQENLYPKFQKRAAKGSKRATEWVEQFAKVSELLWLGSHAKHVLDFRLPHPGAKK
ncbi:MAG: DUF3536 domain-containing protein [Candidatus Abyssubacteria bacterium]